MLIEGKKIMALPIAAMEEESRVGEITQLVIDPENGHLLGFLVKTGSFFATAKALSVVDIRDWDPNGIVIESINSIVAITEIVRFHDIVQKKIFILDMKAVTESGKNLGTIDNLLLDTETLTVVKYYVKNILSGDERVFPANNVVKIGKEVVFSDDVSAIPIGAAGVPA